MSHDLVLRHVYEPDARGRLLYTHTELGLRKARPMLTHDEIELLKRVAEALDRNPETLWHEEGSCKICDARREDHLLAQRALELLERLELAQ